MAGGVRSGAPQLDELSLASLSGSEDSVATASRKRGRSGTPTAEAWSGGSTPTSVTLDLDKNSPLASGRVDYQQPAVKKLRLASAVPQKPKLQRNGSISGFFQDEDAKTAVNFVGLPELSEHRASNESAGSALNLLFTDFANIPITV